MFYAGQSRTDLRRSYADAWRKQRQGALLSPLEAQLAAVIDEHPEYHRWLESEDGVAAEFTPEGGQSNPFLHLGMHLALRDQVAAYAPGEAVEGVTDTLARETVWNVTGSHSWNGQDPAATFVGWAMPLT